MNLLNNHVLLQVEHFFSDSIKLSGGQVLYIDTTTQNPRYATTQGTVIEVPESLVCCRRNNQHSLEWETRCELLPGDRVWFQYDAIITALKDKALHFIKEDKLHILVNYRWMYVARRGEQVIPLNGYCLCEPVYADEYPELIPMKFKHLIVDQHTRLANLVRVKYLAEPNTKYQEKVYSDDISIQVGDLVRTDKHCDIPLEYDLYRSFDEKNEIYRIQRRNMTAVIGIEE